MSPLQSARAVLTGVMPVLAVLGALWPSLAGAVLPIEHWKTSTGARVYFVNAPSIPMLDLSLSFDAGGRYDPSAKDGLASLTNSMLAKGAAGLDENQIAERFANVGALRSEGAGDDRATVSLRTLSGQEALGASLETLEILLGRPSFPATVLAREKERLIQALREGQTKPSAIANRTFSAMLYGDHPYGRSATPETVAAIERQDLLRFWQANYGASRAVVAMIGAISRQQAEQIAERLTRVLPVGETAPSVPAVISLKKSAEQRIENPSTQSHILIGAPAVAWGDPDQFALLVGNYVLGGGGFVSRLYNEVREKRGLAYSVYSYFSPSLQAGPFTVGLQTAREQTDVALGVVRETLTRFLTEGPTEQELAAAKANLVGGFALRIDSNRKILNYLSAIGVYDLPLDYLDRWTEKVSAVTLEQVRAAFARHVQLDALVTVVVGAGTPAAK